jgi:hypothetical protein
MSAAFESPTTLMAGRARLRAQPSSPLSIPLCSQPVHTRPSHQRRRACPDGFSVKSSRAAVRRHREVRPASEVRTGEISACRNVVALSR